jgi:NADPH-dependent FMN reductase
LPHQKEGKVQSPADSALGNPPVRIQIILGSTREGRFGDRVANWFYGLAAGREDLVAQLIDLRDWPLPFFDEPASPIYRPLRCRGASLGGQSG